MLVKYRIVILFSLILCINDTVKSQDIEVVRFVRFFNNQSFLGKVNSFDTINDELKLRVYPLIKNELEIIKKKAQADNQVEVLNRLVRLDADMYFINKNFSKAVPIYIDLLAKGKLRDYKDSAKIFFNLKNSYISLSSLNKAVEIHKQLAVLKRRHDDISDWVLMPSLSHLYYEMHLYEESLNQQLLEFNEINGDVSLLVNYFNNRGLYWIKAGRADSAIVCFKKAKSIKLDDIGGKKNKSVDDEFVLGLIDGNIAQAYILLNECKKAVPLLMKDIQSSKKALNYHNAALSMFELSKCYLNLSNFELSKKYLDSSQFYIKNIDDVKAQLNILKQYSVYYEKTGQLKLANEYLKNYLSLKDSTDSKISRRELLMFQINSQLAEKEKLIIQNQNKVTERNIELNRQRNLKNLLILGGIVLVAVIVFISFQLRKTNYRKNLLELKNKKIQTRNKIIQKALYEKDILIKEVHHRVKNNLQIISSLLRLQASKTSNTEVITSLTEAQDRINSMALLHQLLYRNHEFTKIKFDDYVVALINNVKHSFSNSEKTINIIHRLERLELDLDTSIPLGLITNELISNCYKHAFEDKEGEIKIELFKLVKSKYCLKISDNGKGLPENMNISDTNSLGLEIVSILSQQINAELKYYNQSGAVFEIIFSADV